MPWWEKTGVTLGMGMTERQGGTDVRTNITRPWRRRPCRDFTATNGSCRRRCAMAFLVLAQAPAGLTCYLMPRYRPDGSQNALRFRA